MLVYCGSLLLNVYFSYDVPPSFRPAISPDVFFELDHKISLNFSMVLETLMKMCLTEPECLEKFFLPSNWEDRPNIGFFKFKEKKLGH